MKSNRMRLYKPNNGIKGRLDTGSLCSSEDSQLRIEELPAPLPIAKVSPDQLIEDILIATLRRVQNSSSPEVAAAAARYISLLAEQAL